MLCFRIVRYKNFLATGNFFTEIQLDYPGKTLILGHNGSGKTSILEAIVFALYGKAYRKVNKQGVINSVNKKDCLVEIEFTSGKHHYKVVRGLKPNRFEIYKDDVLIDQQAARDYQRLLEEDVLKMNYRTFCQIVILGSNYAPFMKLTPWERREVVEDLLDIKTFTVMNQLLKEKVQRNRESLTEVNNELKLVELEINFQHKLVVKDKESKENLIRDRESKKETMFALLAQEEQRAQELLGEKARFAETRQKMDAISQEMRRLESMLDRLVDRSKREARTLDFYKNNSVCDRCHQNIDVVFKEQMKANINQTVDQITAALTELNKRKKSIQDNAVHVQEKLDELKNIDLDLASSRATQEHYRNSIAELDDQITKIQKETEFEDNRVRIDQLNTKRDSLIELRDKLERESRVLGYASGLLKDGGIKAKVIKQYIPVINGLINKFLSMLDFFVQFEINEEFKEVIRSRFRDEFEYDNFSEGEKTRINVAILFAWRAVARMRNSSSTNLLIMDEILDGSMDNIGVEEFLKLMDYSTEGNSLFVISHRGDTLIDKFDRSILFEKQGNFSRIAN